MNRTIEKLINRWLTRKLSWMDEVNSLPEGAPAASIGSRSALIPLADESGAILLWTFDVDEDGRDCVLFARLTEDEAESVYTADHYTVGMLEPVRKMMTHRFAVIGKRNRDGSIHGRPFYIPKRVSERLLTDRMIKGASYAPMSVAESYAHEMSRVLTPC